jgi:glutathione peroxidase
MSSSWGIGSSIWNAAKVSLTKGVYAGASKWTAEMGTFHTLSAISEKGDTVDFSTYAGKICLVTNVASKCGFTESSYKAMQGMIDNYNDRGLEILLFPCNQFMGQEPTDAAEAAAEMCTMFGMQLKKAHWFEKGDVNGKNTQAVYTWLKQAYPGDITWNFASKFIIGADGKPLARFDHGTKWSEIEEYIVEHLPAATLATSADDSADPVASDEVDAASDEKEEASETAEEPEACEADAAKEETLPDFADDAKAAVDAYIGRFPVVLFSKSYCPYCKKSKTLLSKYIDLTDTANVRVFELDEMEAGDAVQAYLGELTGATTVPRMFVGGESVGGNDDAHKLDSAGGLEPKIKAAL